MKREIKIVNLKPTQLALGMLEVQDKVKEYKRLGKKKLQKSICDRPIEVVVAPNGWCYVVDGHHRLCAQWLLHRKKTVVKIRKDFSKTKMSYQKFWQKMKRHRWTHLYDQYGEGPQDPIYLPEDVKGMADDPYRSLAYLAQKSGAYDKPKRLYASFEWANYFRKEKLLECDFEKHFCRAKKKAIAAARSHRAKSLPGYKGAR